MQNSSERCKIIVDAMGGDFAPENAVVGAIEASIENSAFDLFLVGREAEIQKVIKGKNLKFDNSRIINADEIIDMGDSPTDAIKKKPNSSIVIGNKLVKEGKANAFVSAGNTGACVSASTLIMGRLKGVERPTIGTYIPNLSGVTTVFDVGAFVDSKPQHLLGYAELANVYVREMYSIPNPTIGLLTVGEEKEKGNKLSKESFDLLKNSNLNFIGNIEGGDVLTGKVNIVICDGFVGNILLKFGESFLKIMKPFLEKTAEESIWHKIKIGIARKSIRKTFMVFDPNEYGGIPLLGVRGISIIGHGSSSPKGIKNMVFRAYDMYTKNLNKKIEDSLKHYASLTA